MTELLKWLNHNVRAFYEKMFKQTIEWNVKLPQSSIGNMAKWIFCTIVVLASMLALDSAYGRRSPRPRANSRDDDEENYVATLAHFDSSGQRVVVCLGGREIGQRFYYSVRFHARPRPFRLHWVAQNNARRTVTIYENESYDGYKSYPLEEDLNGYSASLRIDSLSKHDIDVADNYKLIVENAAGLSEFLVSISSNRSCEEANEEKMVLQYSCDLRRDRHCRCNSENKEECCSADPLYEGPSICEECIERSDRDDCKFCDASHDECMMLASRSASLTDACTLPKVIGKCRAAIPRWYFDGESQECEQFYYGGCDGNANNFETKEDCDAKCSVALTRNAKNNAASSDSAEAKVTQVLLRGCLELGASLLEYFQPNGEKRASRQRNDVATEMKELRTTTCEK